MLWTLQVDMFICIWQAMADISVKNNLTGDLLEFDTVAEVGTAAAFVGRVIDTWGEGLLLKPNGRMFTDLTPQPIQEGAYIFRPMSGTISVSSNADPAAYAGVVARIVYISWFLCIMGAAASICKAQPGVHPNCVWTRHQHHC